MHQGLFVTVFYSKYISHNITFIILVIIVYHTFLIIRTRIKQQLLVKGIKNIYECFILYSINYTLYPIHPL